VRLTVVEYIREDESNPYREWFDGLDAQAAAKVATAALRLEMGNTSRVKWIGAIGEYRIDWGPGYWIYMAKDGNALIILFVAARREVSEPIYGERKGYSRNTRHAKPRQDLKRRGERG